MSAARATPGLPNSASPTGRSEPRPGRSAVADEASLARELAPCFPFEQIGANIPAVSLHDDIAQSLVRIATTGIIPSRWFLKPPRPEDLSLIHISEPTRH